MNPEILLIAGVVFLAAVTLIGIFATKTAGFGRFSSSLVLLASVLFTAALFLAAGKVESGVFANIAFAVAGFAGGLITGKANGA